MPIFVFTSSSGSSSSTPAAAQVSAGSISGAEADRDWALDPIDGDLDLNDDGDARFNRGAEAIASDLQSEFQMWLGEWYLDRQKGFPWMSVLGVPLDEDGFRRLVEEHAALVPGVVEIQNYALERDAENRSFSVDFEAKADTGAIVSVKIESTP
jgi:hypothetical protein